MPFVKLDTGILESTLWIDRSARDVFITALLMAEPHETMTETSQIEVDSLKETGFKVPPGWYGFVRAAGQGIIRRALVEYMEGMDALRTLGACDLQSRSPEFEGRRMVRVDGGFLILNYFKYRDRDYSNAERQARWRERQKRNTVTITPVTHADADADAEKVKYSRSASELVFENLWKIWPRHEAKTKCKEKFVRLAGSYDAPLMFQRAQMQVDFWNKEGREKQFIPMLQTWLNQKRFDTEPEFIERNGNGKKQSYVDSVLAELQKANGDVAD